MDNGTFDISVAGGASSILSLSGTGNVTLGGNALTLSNAADTFDGIISGAGGSVEIAGTAHRNIHGHQHLYRRDHHRERARNSIFQARGSISDSSGVRPTARSTFPPPAAARRSRLCPAPSTGDVELGGETLTLTAASTTFAGEIHGAGGGLTINGLGSVETLSGTGSDYSGTTTITSAR